MPYLCGAAVSSAMGEEELAAAEASGVEPEDQLGAAIDAHNVQEVLPT